MRRSLLALFLTAGATAAVLRYRTPAVSNSAVPQRHRSELPLAAPGTTVTTSTTTAVPASTPATVPTPTTIPPTTRSTAVATTATTTTVATVVVTGPAEPVPDPGTSYRYGVVQLRVTFRGSSMTAIDTIQLPPDGDTSPPSTYQVSKSDSDYAAPILVREALQAQSARIQTVSGATYTSDAFIQSLQAAINQVRH